MARLALRMASFSAPSWVLPLRRMPAVSIRRRPGPPGRTPCPPCPGWCRPPRSPGSAPSPAAVLTSDDLPTLGRPMMANRSSSTRSAASPSDGGSCSTTSSRRSPVSVPLRAEIRRGSPRPSRYSSWAKYGSAGESALLPARITGLDPVRRMAATSSSSPVTPVAHVHHEDAEVGLGDGHPRLLLGAPGQLGDPGVLRHQRGVEARGVHQGEAAASPLGHPVEAVPGQPRGLVDDRLALPGQPVEEGGLADVGPADDGDDAAHRSQGGVPAAPPGAPGAHRPPGGAHDAGASSPRATGSSACPSSSRRKALSSPLPPVTVLTMR